MTFSYKYKAHETNYSGVKFRSRLEARWAAFFDLAKWEWKYEPIDLPGWTPDFWVKWSCGHSECNGHHTLLVEVKPYSDIREFDNHPCMRYLEGIDQEAKQLTYAIREDSSAGFGIDPSVTYWSMSHGSGGGDEEITRWVENWKELWADAGNKVRFTVR